MASGAHESIDLRKANTEATVPENHLRVRLGCAGCMNAFECTIAVEPEEIRTVLRGAQEAGPYRVASDSASWSSSTPAKCMSTDQCPNAAQIAEATQSVFSVE